MLKYFWCLPIGAAVCLACAVCTRSVPRPETEGRQAREAEVVRLVRHIDDHPDDRSALVTLGGQYWMLGQLDDAAATFRKALALTSDAVTSLDLLQVLYSRGHYVEAAELARSIPADAQPEWLRTLSKRFDQLIRPAQATAIAKTRRSPDADRSNSIGMHMVEIPGGPFPRGDEQGASDHRPLRTISLSAYFIGTFEVTVDQYNQFVRETGYRFEQPVAELFEPKFNAYPAAAISWVDAQAFTMWLSAREHAVYRLPTEAEWEFAARGSTGFREPWGNRRGTNQVDANWGLTSPADFKAKIPPVRPVGSFPNDRSSFGVFDMAGNVSEWCLDEYDATYYAWSPVRNPHGPVSGIEGVKVLRGGSWNHPGPGDFAIRRSKAASNQPYTGYGFRVVRELQIP